ncbi:hypothetical protein DFH08DRAFT_1072066 [Mycena albidolilacea]|uniref:F-box domain-containing protein n=1 Tax=Mycena albidolilacea TaxID=1033008 RepID=A0AAD7ARC6_9AGAR|nr:hypothetical protein DFH08DRAFT_1072066 [Mycena albidolilacea]
MDLAIESILKSNNPPDTHQAHAMRGLLASALSELSALDATLLKLPLVSAELQKQRNCCGETVTALRSALSPLRSIPPEILAEVFLVCRDEALWSFTYSIADVYRVPMLLTHVSSRWRGVCLSTQHLWDNVIIDVDAATAMPSHNLVRQIIARSGMLPLRVSLTTAHSTSDIDPRYLQQVLAVLFEAQDRLQDISLDILYLDLPTAFWGQSRRFPLLSSVKIELRDEEDGIFDSAGVVILRRAIFLSLRVPLNARVARDLLIQCPELHMFDVLLDSADSSMQPLKKIYSYKDLSHFTIFFEVDQHEFLALFFAQLAFPSHRYLLFSSQTESTHILQELYHRAPFKLVDLVLMELDHGTDDIISFLQLLPSLQTLVLECFGFTDALFSDFTFNPRAPVPSLTLPLLRSLKFSDLEYDENFIEYHGSVVATLAESVSQHLNGRNPAFPMLQSLILHLSGPAFDHDVEQRPVEACSSGVVRYSRESNPDRLPPPE